MVSLLPNPTEASIQPPFQPLFLSAIGQTLKEMGDPDWKIVASRAHSYASGVRLGVGVKLPRTPAVFKKKTHWRRYDESEIKVRDQIEYVGPADEATAIKNPKGLQWGCLPAGQRHQERSLQGASCRGGLALHGM